MKTVSLFLFALLSCYCNFSYAKDSSKAICEKGIFPSTQPGKEGIIPSMTEDTDNQDPDTENSTTQSSENQDNENQNSQSSTNQCPMNNMKNGKKQAPSGK